MNMYLVLCTDQQDQRWYEITDEPYITDHRAAHYGPIKVSDNDHHCIMDAMVSLANENDFALDDEDTWPLEE